MTAWDGLDIEVRDDIKLAAHQQLSRRHDRILSQIEIETDPESIRQLLYRSERLARAIAAIGRLP